MIDVSGKYDPNILKFEPSALKDSFKLTVDRSQVKETSKFIITLIYGNTINPKAVRRPLSFEIEYIDARNLLTSELDGTKASIESD
jgi:hypothetical protein